MVVLQFEELNRRRELAGQDCGEIPREDGEGFRGGVEQVIAQVHKGVVDHDLRDAADDVYTGVWGVRLAFVVEEVFLLLLHGLEADALEILDRGLCALRFGDFFSRRVSFRELL